MDRKPPRSFDLGLTPGGMLSKPPKKREGTGGAPLQSLTSSTQEAPSEEDKSYLSRNFLMHKWDIIDLILLVLGFRVAHGE